MQIDISKILLHPGNPRHARLESQEDIIRYLCEKEQVINLAKDISEHGLNPAENFIIFEAEEPSYYYCAEGNRRLCALKLLQQPSLHQKEQSKIERWTQNNKAISKINCIIIDDEDKRRLWLNRIHGGQDSGRGRKPWSSEQKTRHTNQNQNVHALQLIDLALELGLLTKLESYKKLSAVNRYLKSSAFKNKWYLKLETDGNISSRRSKYDIKILLAKFMRDIASKKVDTRNNIEDIIQYVQTIETGLTLDNKIEDNYWLLSNLSEKATNGLQNSIQQNSSENRSQKNNNVALAKALKSNAEVTHLLHSLDNYKLLHLYSSLCNIQLSKNVCLLTIGVWCFLETLFTVCGKNQGTSFDSFVSKQRLQDLKVTNHQSVRQAISRIHENGNTSKHDGVAGSFNPDQLSNDFETVSELLISMLKEQLK